ncbi:SDR family oxidoreductase [Kribbella sancticallisti]|uniref:SDR family oxidoreductase n=1 Tax=Kribbella sancticallisti TaxID=460087 RepID=A0ABN2EIA5_9ACTN
MTKDIALVTGGNKGLGREIVRQLATEGLTVHLGARDNELGRAAQRELAAEGLDVRFVQLDVTDDASVEAAAKSIEAENGRLDVLVNNAGIMIEWDTAAADVTVDQLRQVYDVNVFGVARVTRAFIPLLRRSANGRIVNLSSGLGSISMLSDPENPISQRGFLAYSSSKAALNALTVLYANALRADGIKVNAANPGLVPTDLNVRANVDRGTRTPAEGVQAPVELALRPTTTGAFVSSGSAVPLPW